MNKYFIAPEAKGSEGFLELARTPKTSGRLFRKHILTVGKSFYYNNKKFDITEDFADSLVRNFEAKHCDIVQVPVVDDLNAHSEDPTKNIGEVVNLTVEDGKVYTYIDARKHADDVGKTLIGASAMLSLNYVNTETNEAVGPTLLHVAVTNRPHLNNLDDYEEIALSSDPSAEVILLSEESEEEIITPDPEEINTMELEQILAELKEKHGIDVTALQTQVAEAEVEQQEALEALQAEKDALVAESAEKEELAVSLSNAISEAFGKVETLSLSSVQGVAQAEELIGVVAEAGVQLSAQQTQIVELSGRIEGLEVARKSDASTAVVDDLVRAGKILPANKEAMIELHLSNQELFAKIVPDAPIIDLSAGSGSDETLEGNQNLVKEEVTRLLSDTK